MPAEQGTAGTSVVCANGECGKDGTSWCGGCSQVGVCGFGSFKFSTQTWHAWGHAPSPVGWGAMCTLTAK
jgi:hypothetical protein